MSQLGPVEIGAREIYDLLLAVCRDMQEVKSDLRVVSVDLAHVVQDQADVTGRVSRLEAGRWPLPALAVLISMLGVAWQMVRPGKG